MGTLVSFRWVSTSQHYTHACKKKTSTCSTMLVVTSSMFEAGTLCQPGVQTLSPAKDVTSPVIIICYPPKHMGPVSTTRAPGSLTCSLHFTYLKWTISHFLDGLGLG